MIICIFAYITNLNLLTMKHLFKALADFQQEVPVIHRSTQGYGYTYADLPRIFEIINPLLKKHGLGFTQLINGTQIATCLFHIESGESIESKIDIPQGVILKGMNEFQVLGSAITYLRRYSLSSMLGLVTDKDTDASGEQIKVESKKPLIDNKRFEEALVAIQNGKYTVNQLKAGFELTEVQTKSLLLC